MAAVLAAALVVAGTSGATAGPAHSQADPGRSCPVLWVLGVQGANETGAGASATTDSGVLSEIFQPLTTAAPAGQIDRAYVSYDTDPDAGAILSGDQDHTPQYDQAMARALSELRKMSADFATRCPTSDIAVAGYREGAAVASQFAQQVGHSGGAIPADRVAGVALLDDPSRAGGAALFPGTNGRSVPAAAPGTTGAAVTAVQPLTQHPAGGGGIGDAPGSPTDFGTLAGRVASVCIPGDLVCDTPAQSPIQRVVANITGTAADAHGDPIRALGAVTQALATTTINTVSTVIDNDVQGNSLATLDYSPGKSLAERVADASDPRTPLDLGAALRAVVKIGTIGLNAVVTAARTILTPSNIAQIATAGLADPMAGLAMLGQKLLAAVPQLVPPTTVIRLVSEAFTAVLQNLAVNIPGATNTSQSDTTALTTAVKYSDELGTEQPYSSAPIAEGGQAPVQFVTDWFSAAARDLAAAHPRSATVAPSSAPSPWNSLPTTDPDTTSTPARPSTSDATPTAGNPIG